MVEGVKGAVWHLSRQCPHLHPTAPAPHVRELHTNVWRVTGAERFSNIW